MRKFVMVCAAFGVLALTALWSSPAHAEPVTDPVTGITIDVGGGDPGPDTRVIFEPTQYWVVYVWDAQQGYVIHSSYAWDNVRAQNDCDWLNANGYTAFVGVVAEGAVDPSQLGG